MLPRPFSPASIVTRRPLLILCAALGLAQLRAVGADGFVPMLASDSIAAFDLDGGASDTWSVVDPDTMQLNGEVVCTSEAGPLREGPVGFQSEGAEIHFAALRIKELP